ncbi:MAG TPA: ubiquitin carboxyl-terminal hydrolase family protein [Chlamydiales bacterium]|nr:ubiquitin carboxyl-terminal hydrolase family protein [Chlamydiales bacterium]
MNTTLAKNSLDGKVQLQATESEGNARIKNLLFKEKIFTSATLSPPLPPIGIPNLGNTCYIASVIQASMLFQKSALQEKLITADANERKTIQAILDWIHEYENTKGAINLHSILRILQQNGMYNGTQQDAAELITWLGNFQPNSSVYFQQIFKTVPLVEGEFIIEDEGNRSQLVREIPLEVECSHGTKQIKPGQTLLSLLKKFFSEIDVQDQHAYRDCLVQDNQGNLSERRIPVISKKEILSSAPKELTLQIKKFSKNHNTGVLHRLEGALEDVPEIFVMPQEYCANGETATYQLRSVISHLGSNLDGGHYVAYVRKGNSYFYANDRRIEKIDREGMLEGARNGYILIYDKIVQPSQ